MIGATRAQQVELLSGVTANTTSASFNRRYAANWSYQATVTGTGAVAANVQIQVSNDNANWIALGSAIALTATTVDSDSTTSTVPWAYHRAVLTGLTGTGATVTVIAVGI